MEYLKDHIQYLNDSLKENERIEDYDECAYIRDKLKAIEYKDEIAFLNLYFDIQGLTESGLFKSDITDKERVDKVKEFFGYKSIFEFTKYYIGGVHLSTVYT